MNEDNCARLEKIQGGVDLINERLKHSNQLQDERHFAIRKDIDSLGGRVGTLETESSMRAGERQGIALGGRIIWTIIGAVPVGIAAVALKLLGV